MTTTHAYPLTTYYSAYVDQKKSVPYIDKSGQLQNPRGLAFWTLENRYLENIDDYLNVIKKLELELHEVNDPKTEKLICKFYTVKGKSGVWDGKEGNGMVDFQYTNQLWAYRKRKDGLLGIEGFGVDTRLGEDEKKAHPDRYPLEVRGTNKLEANFSSIKGKTK